MDSVLANYLTAIHESQAFDEAKELSGDLAAGFSAAFWSEYTIGAVLCSKFNAGQTGSWHQDQQERYRLIAPLVTQGEFGAAKFKALIAVATTDGNAFEALSQIASANIDDIALWPEPLIRWAKAKLLGELTKPKKPKPKKLERRNHFLRQAVNEVAEACGINKTRHGYNAPLSASDAVVMAYNLIAAEVPISRQLEPIKYKTIEGVLSQGLL